MKLNPIPCSDMKPAENWQRGFSLLEMIIVVAIIGILASIAIPSFNDMIAEQRVRAVASEVVGDMVLARVEAIKQQRRVVMERTGSSWKNGWNIYVDTNADGTFSVGEAVIKSFSGVTDNTMKICPITVDLADRITFRGDGTVVNVAIGTESGLRVSDDKGTTWAVGNGGNPGARTRDIPVSPAGRASVETLDKAGGIACP